MPLTIPLLGRFTLETTWANVREHAAGPPDYWGSMGERDGLGGTDCRCVGAGQAWSSAVAVHIQMRKITYTPLIDRLTRTSRWPSDICIRGKRRPMSAILTSLRLSGGAHRSV
jgi:hypothetical protein